MKVHPVLLKEDYSAYTNEGAARKEGLHKEGKKLLRAIAEEMGLNKEGYDLRSNLGGVAVSGEVTLHADHLYLQIYESCTSRGLEIMYRECDGRKDYCGKQNNYFAIKNVSDEGKFSRFIEQCKLFARTAIVVDDTVVDQPQSAPRKPRM